MHSVAFIILHKLASQVDSTKMNLSIKVDNKCTFLAVLSPHHYNMATYPPKKGEGEGGNESGRCQYQLWREEGQGCRGTLQLKMQVKLKMKWKLVLRLKLK